MEAEYCACTIPLPVLATIETDFAPEFKRAIASFTYASAGKMGLQFKRRFWEEDDGIYGGATRTDQDITQILYLSTGFNGRKGVLVGYYIQDVRGRLVGERMLADRVALALEQASASTRSSLHGVRVGVLRRLAPGEVERRELGGVRRRRPARLSADAAAARRPRVSCRLSRVRHQCVDAGCIRIGPQRGDQIHARAMQEPARRRR